MRPGAHTAQYDVDLWGRLAADSDAARQRLQAQAWARAAVAWSLTAQMAEARLSRRAVQRQVEIGEAVRGSRAQTLELRQREQKAGVASEFDMRRAEAELAGADTTLVALRRQQVALDATLALLRGRPLGEVAALDLTDQAQQARRYPQDRLPSSILVPRHPAPGRRKLLLAGAVRARRPDIPIVLMSGFVSPALAQRARELGVHEVLAKPLASGDIARCLA